VLLGYIPLKHPVQFWRTGSEFERAMDAAQAESFEGVVEESR